MTIDLFLLQTMFIRLIVDWSTFNSCAISISVIDWANNVAIFPHLSSSLDLCVTKISLCILLFVKGIFMHFEETKLSIDVIYYIILDCIVLNGSTTFVAKLSQVVESIDLYIIFTYY